MASTHTPANSISTTDHRIVKFYNDYDSNIDGYLTLEDFLKFYRDNAENK
jgi:Ca2+-binding EF-hand superfamily protein